MTNHLQENILSIDVPCGYLYRAVCVLEANFKTIHGLLSIACIAVFSSYHAL